MDIAVPNIPRDVAGCAEFIKSTARKSFTLWAQLNKRNTLDLKSERADAILKDCYSFLTALETIEVSPRLKDKASLDVIIKFAFANQAEYKFPEPLARRAEALYDKWVENEWGAVEASLQLSDSDDDVRGQTPTTPTTASRRTAHRKTPSTSNAAPVTARLPPTNHPIYGVGKIMDGVLFMRGGQRPSYRLNPAASDRGRDHRKLGANGLIPGQWFPNQISALFHGAHGSSQGGISGTKAHGARSVVISGLYHDLDSDRGDVVWYSGSDSHDNENPNSVGARSAATECLFTSLKTGLPVRVLRKAGGASILAPSVGIRYDGLYVVADTRQAKNLKGGLYEQFKLVRMQDQKPLDDICKESPTREEQDLAARVRDGY